VTQHYGDVVSCYTQPSTPTYYMAIYRDTAAFVDGKGIPRPSLTCAQVTRCQPAASSNLFLRWGPIETSQQCSSAAATTVAPLSFMLSLVASVATAAALLWVPCG
jgi:hypothetical protein